MRRQLFTVSMAMIFISLFVAACSPSSQPSAAPAVNTQIPPTVVVQSTDSQAGTSVPAENSQSAFPSIDPADFSGDINAAGSSTVYPLAVAIAEQFKNEGFQGNINIASVGTGGGFERFCKTGETDISNASRQIKDSETANCAALNPPRTPIAFRVGTDALAVVVSKDNTFAKDITLEELGHLLTDAVKWSDVRTDWPAETIQRFIPGTDSGTFDFMVEFGIQKPLKIDTVNNAKAASLAAANQQASEDDNVLVQGVEGSPYAIGYFGFAYYKNQESRLTALSINGITPDFDTAESGTYPLARPLFIYSDAAIMKAKPQVAAFIAYFLGNVNDLIEQVGYFPASQEALDGAKQTYLDVMK